MVKRRSVIIIFLAWLASFISYLGQTDYSSCLVEIINQTGVAKATAGMVSSSFALCNAVGQLSSVVLVKRFPVDKVIALELVFVAAVNLLLPMTDSFLVMAILWGINGCMQSTLLCGLTQLFAQTLKEPYLSRGAVMLNTVGAVGGLTNYILSYALIKYFNWKIVFHAVSTLLFIFAIVWCSAIPKLMKRMVVETEIKATEKERSSVISVLKSHGAFLAVLGAFFIGTLRESVTLWLPSYMKESFSLSGEISILITAFVPCFQICGNFLGGGVGRNAGNLFVPACISFTISGVCLFAINVFGSTGTAVTMVLFVANAISMTAALTILLSLFPVRYMDRCNLALLTGITNFAVKGGNFAASSGIGFLSENYGWVTVFNTLGTLALTGGAICIAGRYVCKRQGF